MSDGSDFNDELADLSERYLLHLRALGPMPDLGHLDAAQRAEVGDRFDLLDALADRPVGPPPRDEDPVAARLGLVAAGQASAGDRQAPEPPDPVRTVLHDVQLRFGSAVDLLWETAWMVKWLSVDLTPVVQCDVLGVPMAIFACDRIADGVGDEPVEIGRFLRRYPEIAAVTLVTHDASRAVVLNDASCHRSIDPARGWVPPGAYVTPSPFALELQRFLDSRLPRWDAVAGAERYRGGTDVRRDAAEATGEALASALRAKPRLEHKQLGQASLRHIDMGELAALVVGTQSGAIEPEELPDLVLALGEAAT